MPARVRVESSNSSITGTKGIAKSTESRLLTECGIVVVCLPARGRANPKRKYVRWVTPVEQLPLSLSTVARVPSEQPRRPPPSMLLSRSYRKYSGGCLNMHQRIARGRKGKMPSHDQQNRIIKMIKRESRKRKLED